MTYLELKQYLLTGLLAEPTLTVLIDDRLYFVNYASLANLIYPAVTFQAAEGQDYLGIISDFPAIAYAHSDITFDEANAVMDVLCGLLDGRFVQNKAVIRVTGNPIENYVEEPRLYNVAVPLHVWVL